VAPTKSSQDIGRERQEETEGGCLSSIPLAAEQLEKVTEKIETKLQSRLKKKMQFLYFPICQYAIIR
jgi:F0F1-type ATP synthase delta subunit